MSFPEVMDSSDMSPASGTKLAKGVAAHLTKPLPVDFVLGDNDVICGRGSRCFNHVGNKKFRKIVEAHLEKYTAAISKAAKTEVICEIVNIVRAGSPDGGFVKKDKSTGLYYEVGDFLAREKTSQAFRDALHDQYKSSNATKKKRRLNENIKRGFSSAPTLGSYGRKSGAFESSDLSSQQNFTFSLNAQEKESLQANRNMDELDKMLKRGLKSTRSMNSVLDFGPLNIKSNMQEISHEQWALENPRDFAQKSESKYASTFSCPNLNTARMPKANVRQASNSGFANFTFGDISPITDPKPSAIACGKRNLLLERIMGKLQSEQQQQRQEQQQQQQQQQKQQQQQQQQLQTKEPAASTPDSQEAEQNEVDIFDEMPFQEIEDVSENPLEETNADSVMFDKLMHFSDHFNVDPADLLCMIEPEPIPECR